MPREVRRSSAERYKYGMCLNDECTMCKTKKIQQIPMRKDLVCEECGKELRECAPPKKGGKMPLVIGGIAAVALIGVGGFFLLSGSDKQKEKPAIADSLKVKEEAKAEKADSTTIPFEEANADAAKKSGKENIKVENVTADARPSKNEPAQSKTAATSNGTLRLSYGTYTGATKNGYAHGQGRITYSTTRQINKNDMKGRTANAGDYVIGEFFNGFVVYGKHYDSAGNLLESLNFGVGSEDSYDSK